VTGQGVPWSGRGSVYTEDEIAFVTQAMRSADPLTQGRYRTEFEQAFAAHVGAPHCFAVATCTAALQLAAELCRIRPGDEVIAPAHTFAASAIPFARLGARLKWADIDPATLVVTAATIAPLITPRTRAIVVVHLYGLMADMGPIMDLAGRHGIPVVEDCAQANGATLGGRQAGSFGDLACFSFHGHKQMTTLGEGGMLVVRDADLAKVVPGLRHNGMRPYAADRERYWLPAMTNVDFDWDGVWPYNFCLGEAQCAAGIAQLKRLPEMNEHRRRRAAGFKAAVADFPELVFQACPAGRVHTYYCLPARYDGAAGRDAVIERLAGHHGVRVIVQYYPLYRYPLFERAGFGAADCPETDRFFESMVSFPFHGWMPEDEFQAMIDATRETLAFLRT
jgi:dTDP-4-amino-4,6-dideoxygalactose transaminase